MRDTLKQLIGSLPSETGFKKRMRFHQGWWRAFVLAEEEGENPGDKDKSVCNTMSNEKERRKNFLNDTIITAVILTIEERKKNKHGLIEENRLYNNLLSSQPLCFNFFGDLKMDTAFALLVLKQFYPELTQVCRVMFEFAPQENYTGDNSAFDVAFEVMAGNRKGLIGLECKYTDTFSSKQYDKKQYREIFSRSVGNFIKPYAELIGAKYNQMFRNQLIAESLMQKESCDFAYTGLFCHHEDSHALSVAKEFQGMLKNGEQRFKIITYRDFIVAIQKSKINWEQRELSMMLWARYCGLKLSDEAFKQ